MKELNNQVVETSLDALNQERVDVIYTQESALGKLSQLLREQARITADKAAIDTKVSDAQSVCTSKGWI